MAPLIQSRTVRNIAFDIQKKIADEISEFADDPTRIKAPRNRLVFDTCRTWRAGVCPVTGSDSSNQAKANVHSKRRAHIRPCNNSLLNSSNRPPSTFICGWQLRLADLEEAPRNLICSEAYRSLVWVQLRSKMHA